MSLGNSFVSKGTPDHPLTGVRVIEVGIYMAGPFCAMQLADLGADVIKIENPDGGDIARDSAPFLDGESSPFIRLNRNKRSLAMNLKASEGKELLRELVQGADVMVENLRPGTMSDLELDYPRLSALNPGLVYVAASGWGQTGPYSQLAGLDIMAQAMSGLMSIVGEPGAVQGQPLASRAPRRPDPDDRTRDVAQAAGLLGVPAAASGRALRRDPDLRSGLQRPAASGPRLLLEGAAFEARRRRADR